MALQIFKISSVEVSSPVASVTFSSIPSGYTDLLVAMSPHTNRSGYPNADMALEVNGSTANLTYRSICNSSTFSPILNSTGIVALFQGGNDGGGTNFFGPTTIYIPNYTSSNYKSMSIDYAAVANSTDLDRPRSGLTSLLWSNTAAITSIKISPNSTTSFTAGAEFYLYGIL
jgi:hypothetical protein